MKAQIKPRIELENRTKLEEVIPLRVPFTVFVDPADSCNFTCKFCPTGDRELMKEVGRPLKQMSLDLFKKIVDDLKELDHPIKVLRMYKDGEPLLNPHFAEMVRYAKSQNVAYQIDTTTNASLMNPKRNLEIIEAGLDRINISIEGVNKEQYLDFAGYKGSYDKLRDNIQHFYDNSRGKCEMAIKICGDTISEDDKKKFFTDFGDMCDRIFIEHIAPCWPEFDMSRGVSPNQTTGIYGQKLQRTEVCPYIFYSLAINSDGKVSACFLDWSRSLIFGDMNQDKFTDIWFGKQLYDFRMMHLNKLRHKDSTCRSCGQLTHCLPDSIDDYADGLIAKMEELHPHYAEPQMVNLVESLV